MTPEEQRIAIAEFCGWKRINPPTHQNWGESARKQEWWYVHQLPNYLEDLNAIHEAEKVLPESLLWPSYYDELAGAVGGFDTIKIVCAAAAQRCEALLKTIGKWK